MVDPNEMLDPGGWPVPKLASAPEIVVALCWNHSAWVVGSAAQYMAGRVLKRPRDLDILVPFSEWDRASVLIPRGTPSNTFGGFKLSAKYPDGEDVHVDIWPGDLTTLLARASMEVEAFHPMSSRYVKSERL